VRDKAKPIELRKEICRRYIEGSDYRFVDADSPEWARNTEDYRSTIDSLNLD
jgi:precorrin-6A synthase